MEEYKALLAEIYRRALAHYGGDSGKAGACVNAYCRGQAEAMRTL